MNYNYYQPISLNCLPYLPSQEIIAIDNKAGVYYSNISYPQTNHFEESGQEIDNKGFIYDCNDYLDFVKAELARIKEIRDSKKELKKQKKCLISLDESAEFYEEEFIDPSLDNEVDDIHDLVIEYCKPNFPPDINIEKYVKKNETNKKIKDHSKRSQANGFFIYRKYLTEYLLAKSLKLSMQEISLLASILWKREPDVIKNEYKVLSNQIKQKYTENLRKCVGYQDVNIKKNGGNGFMIYRAELIKKYKSVPMQTLSSLASIHWKNEPEEVKEEYQKRSKEKKDEHNKRILTTFYKSNDTVES